MPSSVRSSRSESKQWRLQTSSLLLAARTGSGFFFHSATPPDTLIWGFTRQWRSASTDGPQLEAIWRDALIKYRLFPPACWRDGVAFVSAISLDVVRSRWRGRNAEHWRTAHGSSGVAACHTV